MYAYEHEDTFHCFFDEMKWHSQTNEFIAHVSQEHEIVFT